MSYKIIRKIYMKSFRNFDKNTHITSSIILGSYIVQIIILIAIGAYLLSTQTVLAYFGVGFIAFIIATRLRGLNNIVHECTHFTFANNRIDNMVLGSIAAAMILQSFTAYRKEHLTHHAHLGDYEKDLDIQGIQAYHLEDELTWKTIARHVLTPVFGLHLPGYLSVDLSANDGVRYAIQKIGLISITLIFAYFNPQAAVFLVIVPFLWVFTAINYWTDCIDHGGIIGSDDELEASRNMILPKLLRVIFFPRNDCYHLIHHLFPNVPAQHLNTCHDLLLENDAYRKIQMGDKLTAHIGAERLSA